MSRIQQVYQSMQEKKQELKELNQMFKDEISSDKRHKAIVDEMTKLRNEKRGIEQDMKGNNLKDYQRQEDLKLDIKSDKELLADLALNMYIAEENVEIVDAHNQRWVPEFSVRFRKD
jgi:hypothetical protein